MNQPTFDIKCIISSAETGGAMAAFKQITQPGEGPPVHVHREQTEVFHIIDGTYEFTLNGRSTTLTAGGSILIPAGAPHTFKNTGNTAGAVHFELWPANKSEEFFKRVDEEFAEIEDLPAFFDEYGMDLLEP